MVFITWTTGVTGENRCQVTPVLTCLPDVTACLPLCPCLSLSPRLSADVRMGSGASVSEGSREPEPGRTGPTLKVRWFPAVWRRNLDPGPERGLSSLFSGG